MVRWQALAAAVIYIGLLPPAYGWHHRSSDYYRSSDGSDGSMVHRPTRSAGDYGHVTAVCGDGTHSYSHHHQGHARIMEASPSGSRPDIKCDQDPATMSRSEDGYRSARHAQDVDARR